MWTLLILACGTPEAPPEPPPEPPRVEAPAPEWPEPGAPLDLSEPEFPPDFGTRKVYIDPGHAVGTNTGNTGVYCQREEDVTLATAKHLAETLEKTGHFEVRIAREATDGPTYQQRVSEANAWADVFLSIHTDNREPEAVTTWTYEGQECPRLDEHPGFSVLWADDTGTEALQQQRQALASTLSDTLRETGFAWYDGEEYDGKYEMDPEHPGTFVDRHEPGQRIYVLRAPTVPGVIIETHHAWHEQEVLRWQEERTHVAFDRAVARALVDFFTQEAQARREATPEGSSG